MECLDVEARAHGLLRLVAEPRDFDRAEHVRGRLARVDDVPVHFRDDIVSEVDRYIIYPGQATAYMLGAIEISRLRGEAKQVMGARFDIKAFHDRVLEDGAVPVSFLSSKIRAWAGGTR